MVQVIGLAEEKILRVTGSICPKCNKIIKAEVFERGRKVFIRKTCPEHGDFQDLYWSDSTMYKRAESFAQDGIMVSNPNVTKENPVCPLDCGLCKIHKSHTALANVVVSNRCDLHCWYCFYYAEKLGYVYEPSVGAIREMARQLRNQRPVPNNAVQLTGGEPLLRKDLVDIARVIKEEGIEHIQLNTNGIKLSQDPELCLKLRGAGINTLYLSFDGVTPKTNPKNHWEIPGVFENCRKAGIGIVLVPTIIRNVNDHELGDMIDFGFKNSDIVRAVNMQPVSLVGQMPKDEREKHRITIPDAIKAIEEQTNGKVSRDDFYPVPSIMAFSEFVSAITKKPEYSLSSHFACGMGTYIFEVNGELIPISRFLDVDGFLEYLSTEAMNIREGKNRLVASIGLLRKIGSFIDDEKAPKNFKLRKIIWNALIKHNYKALGEFHHKSLFLGMMHFMDKFNYDIERVKRCCIHYSMTDGRIIPFCTFNVIPEMYRDVNQRSQGIDIPKWQEETGKNLKDDYYKRDVKALESSELYRKTYRDFMKHS